MSSPYLKRDESIILTTDRVNINSVQYEVLLTTRNLILVDIRYAQFPPQEIPLSTILSVNGGKIFTGEPVIILSFSDTGSREDSGPMALIFSQQPGEQRKRERDEWLKKLMGLIVSVRQETINTGSPPADEERGIQPSIRRSVAPEKIHPHTTVIDTRPVPVELTILPDEPESLPVSEEAQELPGEAVFKEDTKSDVASGTPKYEETLPAAGGETGSTDTIQLPEVREIADSSPLSQSEVGLPDISTSGNPAARETPGELESDFPDTATTGLSAAGESPGAANANTIEQKSFTHTLQEAVKSLLSSREKKELSDTGTSSELYSEETESVLQEGPGSPGIPTSPEPVVVEAPAVFKKDSESKGKKSPKAGDIEEPGQQPAEEEKPQIPQSPLPIEGHGLQRQTLIAVTAILLVILGIVGGAVFYPQYFTTPSGKEPVPLSLPSLQQFTVQQTPAQQTPVPTPVQQTPVPTPVQQTPVPTPVVIPPEGVWVRVVYSANYHGWVGNPGSLSEVRGSGDHIYKIRESDGIIQVQITKDDNTGDVLMVEIYRNGNLIGNYTRSAPRSSIEFLIDAKTGNPPGITTVVTPVTNRTGLSGGQVMYF
jgi:hypothetical protein